MLIETITPGTPPVSLDNLKLHLSLNDDGVDDLLTEWLEAAVEVVTEATGIVPTQTTFRLTLTEWPDDNTFYIPRRPIGTVSAVTYYDADDNDTDLSASATLDYATGKVILPAALKPATWVNGAKITCTFVAGGNCSARLKTVIRLLASHWYQNREVASDITLADVPYGLQFVVQQLRGAKGVGDE